MEVMSRLLVHPASAPFGHLLDPLHSQVRWTRPADSLQPRLAFPSWFPGHLSNSRLSFPSHGFYKDTPPPRDVHCSPNRHGIETLPPFPGISPILFLHTHPPLGITAKLSPYYCPNALCFPASFLVQEPGKPLSQKPSPSPQNPPARTGSLSPGPQRKYTSPFQPIHVTHRITGIIEINVLT